ncbi:MAG: hypothetical protein ABIF87_03175 [Pseudomonadota bacterium]
MFKKAKIISPLLLLCFVLLCLVILPCSVLADGPAITLVELEAQPEIYISSPQDGFVTNQSEVTPVYADDQTVFGPKDLTINRWHIHLSFHKFRVDDPGDGIIVITKNTPSKKIRGGFFLFNRKFISIRDFLIGDNLVFEKDISLRSFNRLMVFLRGEPGASITIEVRKKSPFPPPVVAFSADPQSITLGESGILSWTTTNADSVSIEGIGSVDLNGSLVVSPTETTTYTLTAMGPGDTTTKNVTVSVNLPPTVSINADPETIQIGESSTLSWTSTHADSCVIEPDIGPVDLSGSTTVSPTETTTYTITATGPGGTATDSVTVTAIYPITLNITSPNNGDTISRPDIMVEGTITNTTGNETGVTINGVVAIVYGNQFVENRVPLQEGENTITATATDTDGKTASALITVYAETTGDYIELTAHTQSGISSLETTLRVQGSFSFTESSLSYTGPGDVEFLQSSAEEYEVRLTAEGTYYFTAEATDGQGNTHTDTIAIVVLNRAELDTLLKAKWDGMKIALINNNIEGALNYFHESSKEHYQKIFRLVIDRLPDIASAMRDIELIYLEDKVAKYRIRKEEEIQGQTYDITYYIYFVKDLNGLWKIESY